MDLRAHIPGYDVEISRSETPQEHEARVAADKRRGLIADCMWVGLTILLAILFLVLLWVWLLKSDATPADRDTAQKLLSPLVTGIVAFVVGRASGK